VSHSLGTSPAEINVAAQACLFIFLGRLADLFGRKRAFVGGMVFSAALSLGCGFAQGAHLVTTRSSRLIVIVDALTLDILRGIQGIGVAAAIPAAVGILAHTFPSGTRARSLAFATFSAAAPVGAALGSVIGGMLTQETSLGWRSNFFFIAALWLASAGGGLLVIEADPPLRGMLTGDQGSDDRRVDWLGALLVTAGLVLVVFVLSQSQTAKDGWRTPCESCLFP
jgi:MFS family permease